MKHQTPNCSRPIIHRVWNDLTKHMMLLYRLCARPKTDRECWSRLPQGEDTLWISTTLGTSPPLPLTTTTIFTGWVFSDTGSFDWWNLVFTHWHRIPSMGHVLSTIKRGGGDMHTPADSNHAYFKPLADDTVACDGHFLRLGGAFNTRDGDNDCLDVTICATFARDSLFKMFCAMSKYYEHDFQLFYAGNMLVVVCG